MERPALSVPGLEAWMTPSSTRTSPCTGTSSAVVKRGAAAPPDRRDRPHLGVRRGDADADRGEGPAADGTLDVVVPVHRGTGVGADAPALDRRGRSAGVGLRGLDEAGGPGRAGDDRAA